MEADTVIMLLGAAATVCGLVAGAVSRERALSGRISGGNAELHKRLDTLKDDMNADFARKDDMRDAVSLLRQDVKGLRDDLQTLTRTLINSKGD